MVATRRQRIGRPVARILLAAGLVGTLALSACSASDGDTTSRGALAPLDSNFEDAEIEEAVGARAPVAETDDANASDSVETDADLIDPTTDPAASEEPTTAAATDPPTTESTTTVPPTTVAPTTTTTVKPGPPANRVPVQALASPLQAVGTSNGSETERVQRRLLELGFWLQSPSGSYDLTTAQAVMAFQKYLGIDASGAVNSDTAALMSNVTLRAYGHSDSGTLLEVDKTRQLLMFIIDGRVQWVFNTSTGNGEAYEEEDQNSPGTLVKGVSLTPDGIHRVERERPEGWWEGDLGQIYRPKYFIGGVAVHGSNSVPNYPASHGCVRVTIQAMDFIWDSGLMPMTLPVWVHENARPA